MKAINIVLHKISLAPDWQFMEIENDSGESIKVGQWVPGKNGAEFKIRITEQDFKDMEVNK